MPSLEETAKWIKGILGGNDEEAESLAKVAHQENGHVDREDILARRMCLGFTRGAASDGTAETYEEQVHPYDGGVEEGYGNIKYGTDPRKKYLGSKPGQSHYPYITPPFTTKVAGRKRSKPRKAGERRPMGFAE